MSTLNSILDLEVKMDLSKFTKNARDMIGQTMAMELAVSRLSREAEKAFSSTKNFDAIINRMDRMHQKEQMLKKDMKEKNSLESDLTKKNKLYYDDIKNQANVQKQTQDFIASSTKKTTKLNEDESKRSAKIAELDAQLQADIAREKSNIEKKINKEKESAITKINKTQTDSVKKQTKNQDWFNTWSEKADKDRNKKRLNDIKKVEKAKIKAQKAPAKKAKEAFNANFGYNLSLMFLAQQLSSAINGYLKSSITYFLEVTGYTNSFYQQMGDLSASWNLFRYNFVSALSNNPLFQVLINMVQSLVDWFNDLSEATQGWLAVLLLVLGGASFIVTFAAQLKILFLSNAVKTAAVAGGTFIGGWVLAGIVAALIGVGLIYIFRKAILSWMLDFELFFVSIGIKARRGWGTMVINLKIMIETAKSLFLDFGYGIQLVFQSIANGVIDAINFIIDAYKKLPFSNQDIPELKHMKIDETDYLASQLEIEQNIVDLQKEKLDLYNAQEKKLQLIKDVSDIKDLDDKVMAVQLIRAGHLESNLVRQLAGQDAIDTELPELPKDWKENKKEEKTTIVNVVIDGVAQAPIKTTDSGVSYISLEDEQAQRNGASYPNLWGG